MSEQTKPVPPPPGWPTGTATPEDFVKAHQYLYYVKSDPVWDDFKYDAYCKEFGLFGGGGSDSAKDYPAHIVKLAEGIWRYHQQKGLLPDQRMGAVMLGQKSPVPDKPAGKPPRKPRGKKAAKPEPEEMTFV